MEDYLERNGIDKALYNRYSGLCLNELKSNLKQFTPFLISTPILH
jgi:hypothetical protein